MLKLFYAICTKENMNKYVLLMNKYVFMNIVKNLTNFGARVPAPLVKNLTNPRGVLDIKLENFYRPGLLW